ncbi:aspartyl-phosphate phosphatase Spo0E family protein [Metabacillus endolithicus]|uniref:Spo0E family sporulation regulatory protein-aspartic acid phosphatase n=1 Tax=Metabacillus endolithicus TaxID=1535204 RepID=A0ABW5BXT6_9BACI|nr:aspartyl-phosphate phosphatase Spo0E family protein [Metabacillus endolithicus]UPG65517.1 aspartyl-phosphate phosphatase Spo0E family protein [Metabacillus endolithicus]
MKPLSVTEPTSPTNADLLVKINCLRVELIEVGLLIGLNHPITISLSQKLDKLISEYQKTQIYGH